MQDNEFYVSSHSGKELYGKYWIPEGNPRAVIVVLHGLGDHISRYENFADFFTGKQVAVIGTDQQGHGRSGGKRGHISNDQLMLADVQQLMLEARRRFTDVPIFLFGHSMGGNFALNYALQHTSKEISGVILSAPFIHPNGMPAARKFLRIPLVGRFLPSYTMTFNLDPMELSNDPSIGMQYLEDPIKHDRISVKLFRQLSRSSRWILENAGRMAYPLLIMHGRDDRIAYWDQSKKLKDKIPDLSDLRIWEGMRHELHHGKSKVQVLEFMLSWICKHLEGRESA
jgi:acylglycerol lipase